MLKFKRMETHGLNPGDPVIKQPWIDETRAVLESSPVVNIYGPKRHGKTATAFVVSSEYAYDFRGFDEETMPMKVDDILFHKLGLTDSPTPKNLSPSECADFLLLTLEQDQRSTGAERTSLTFDETSYMSYRPDFKAFLNALVAGVKERNNFQLILLSHYPLAAYPDLENIAVPEVRVRKWDKATIQAYLGLYDFMKSPEDNVHFHEIAGGNPDGAHAMSYDTLEQKAANYIDRNIGMLGLAEPKERQHALDLLVRISKGEIIQLDDAFTQAAAMHLLIAGVATETPDGALTSAGQGYDAWVLRREKFLAATVPDAAPLTLRLEPLMAKRGGLSARPGTTAAVSNPPKLADDPA